MEHPLHHRAIRSFVLRQGHMSKGQQRAYDTLLPTLGIPYAAGAVLDYPSLFGRTAPVVLEIGFGMGGATAEIAAHRPETDFIGVEVHSPGVGSLLKLIEEQGSTNLRVVQHDAVEVVTEQIAPQSLDGVHVFFPDPWHKKRHNKRRLLQAPFVALLASRIKSGGYFHVATDWEDYAIQILDVLAAEPSLTNTADGYAPRPDYRPLTKFEQRGIRLGHGVWDVIFQKK